MKISPMSDLHLEFDANLELPGGDILILNGDIWLTRHMIDADAFQHRQYINFCKEQLSKYKHVLVTTGNHESYGDVIDDMDKTLRAFLALHAPNATLLMNETIEINGVTFLGVNLWAKCGNNAKQRDIIRGGMNDFQLIRTTREAPKGVKPRIKGAHRIFEPEDAAKLHMDAVNWLWLELPRHKHCVVISHHAPSFESAGGHSYNTDLDSAYCSNQNKTIETHPQIHTWMHGHTHRRENYKIGETRIIANPRGYMFREHISGTFDPGEYDFDTNDVKGIDAEIQEIAG